MKELTLDEFQDRLKAIDRAMKIFSELTENNINRAFIAYQAIFAEREREIFMLPGTLNEDYHQHISRFEKVPCPECSKNMLYRPLAENEEGFKLQWVCSNPDCDTVLNSENDIDWWMNKLRKVDPYAGRSKRTARKLKAREQEG
jgi:hypothetical protein